jgi:hypothetical protein
MVAALAVAQENARQQLASSANSLVEHAVATFTDWYNTEAITSWTGSVVSTVESVLMSLAYTVDAYMAAITGEITGHWVRPTGQVDVSMLRTGITPQGAYGRVADAYRWQQAQLDRAARGLVTGETTTPPKLVSPIHAALDRASAVTDLNTQLLVRNQAQASLKAQQAQGLITGWRRVPHPELAAGGTCGLCWAASTRIYRAGELMPIHHDCHCLPMPVTAEHDIGSVINDGDFSRLYGDAGGTSAAALKRTRYQVNNHGELGPILNPGGTRARSARQAKAAENPRPRRANTREQNIRNLTQKRDGLVASVAKLDQLVAEDPTWGEFRTTVTDRIHDLDQQLQAA